MQLAKDKSFYRTLFMVAIPIAMQNLISFGVQMMDTVMLGMLGEIQLSASSLANQPGFIFNIMTFGIGGGAAVLISQYWGVREMDKIRDIFVIALKISFTLSVVLTVGVLLNLETVMRIFTNEEAVIAEGVRYLRIVAFTYLAYGISGTLMMTLRSVEIVRISVAVSLVSFFINVAVNYALIFGKFGFPAMGVVGAAIGTLCARLVELVIVVFYVFVADKKLGLRFRHLLQHNTLLWKDFLRYGTPVVINETMWSLGMSVQAMILGRLGSDAVAANSICSVVQQFVTVFIFGISNASAVIVGKTIGSQQYDKIKPYVNTLQLFYLVIGVIAGFTMFLLKDVVISFYNITPATKELARQFMMVCSFIVFSISYTAPCMTGILRGGGDAHFVLMLDLIFVWFITIPFGAAAGLWLHLPMPITYLCLKIDEPMKAILSIFRIRSGKWIRNVTRG